MEISTANGGRTHVQVIVAAVLITAAIAITNNSYDPGTESSWIKAHGGADAIDYWRIARAAPGRPEQAIPYHRAQRWLYPHLSGLLAAKLSIDPWRVFRGATLVLVAVSIALFLAIIRTGVPDGRTRFVLAVVLAANPYLFRFYVAFPGMVNDQIFVVAQLLVVLGVIRSDLRWIAAGLVIAVCARQTALALLPGVVGFILTAGTSRLRRSAAAVLVVSSCLFVYWAVSAGAARLQGAGHNLAPHIFGIFTYLSEGPDPLVLTELAARWLLGLALLLPILWVVRNRPVPRASLWLAVVGLGAAVQPLLAGPEVSGGAVQRLAVLGFPALLASLAGMGDWSKAPSCKTTVATVLAVAVGSLHHNYAFIGPNASLRPLFVILYLTSAVVLLLFLSNLADGSGAAAPTDRRT